MMGRVTCLYHVQPPPPHLVLPVSELDGTDVRAADETARTEHRLKEKRRVCFASFFSRKLSQQLTVQKQDYERRFYIIRTLIGLPPSLCYAAWVVTIVPVKLRECVGAVAVAYVSGAETVGAEMSQRRNGGAETVAPKRRRRNVLLRSSYYYYFTEII